MMSNRRWLEERSKGWPKWANVYERWEKVAVPEITEVQFHAGEHYPTLPWIELSSGRQVDQGARPTDDTASHLIRYLNGKHIELKAAYKLLAYCRSQDLSEFSLFVLEPVMERHGENLQGWWHSNARNVLPWHGNDRSRFDTDKRTQEQRTYWQELVQDAAKAWQQIAERRGVVRTPDLMERNSQEYKAYEAYCRAAEEKRERNEYERLKRKFEQQP